MKKIILLILIVLLSVITYTSVANGYKIGGLEVLGVSDIKQINSNLDSEIDNVDKLKTVTYVEKMSELNSSAKQLIKEKRNYEELVAYSKESDVEKANQTQVYEIEVLWTKIGMHATKNGVKLNLDVTESINKTPNMNDLKFTVTGSYISITDFVADIEKDAKLAFSIDEFKLIPDNSDKNLKATFRVKDVALNLNNTNISTDGKTISAKTNEEEKNSEDKTKDTNKNDNTKNNSTEKTVVVKNSNTIQ